MSQQPRKDTPKKFLDASLVPLEQALIARAEALEDQASEKAAFPKQMMGYVFERRLAKELRAIAEELHYW